MKWLPIKNYEGLYEISDTGEVRSVDRILKVTNQKDTLFNGRQKTAGGYSWKYL